MWRFHCMAAFWEKLAYGLPLSVVAIHHRPVALIVQMRPTTESPIMKMKTLEDLFFHELKDLYSAEKQLLKALPKMAKAATNEELKTAFENHLAETEEQVARLDNLFADLGVNGRMMKCKAMEGLIEEGKHILEEDMDDDVRDAGLICAAQKVEHYEIAGYGCVRTFAEQLGHSDAAAVLQQTLEEESAANELLTKIAMSSINEEAMAGE
jgi:ferritin-like metal-binding protein YciE